MSKTRSRICAVAVVTALPVATASPAAGATYPRCPAWVGAPAAKSPASVSYRSQGVAVGPTRATIAAHVAPAAGAEIVVQYGRGSAYLACSAVQHARRGTTYPSLLVKGLLPNRAYRFRVVAKTRAGVVV